MGPADLGWVSVGPRQWGGCGAVGPADLGWVWVGPDRVGWVRCGGGQQSWHGCRGARQSGVSAVRCGQQSWGGCGWGPGSGVGAGADAVYGHWHRPLAQAPNALCLHLNSSFDLVILPPSPHTLPFLPDTPPLRDMRLPAHYTPIVAGPIPFLPDKDVLVQRLERQWGELGRYRGLSITAKGDCLVCGVQLGNVFVGVQVGAGVWVHLWVQLWVHLWWVE